MLVCLCKGVSSSTIEDVLAQKPSCCLRDLMRETKAGTDCGSCVCQMRDMVKSAGATKEPGSLVR